MDTGTNATTTDYSETVQWLQYEYIPVRGPAVVSTGALYERYIKYTEAAGFKPLSRSRLGCLVLKIFPSVRVKRNNNREYEGLRLNFGDNTAGTGEMFKTEANNFGFIKMTDNGESSAYCLFTGFQINGNEVLKILKFNQDGTWSLRVRGIVVDPALIGLSGIKGDNLFAIRTVLNMIKQTRICKGRLVTSKKDSNRNSKFQEWTQTGNENSQTHRASSASCQGVTLLLGEGELCFSCQKQKFTQPSNKQTNNSEDADTLISKLFPTANELMIKFLKTQSEICQKSADKLDSRSRRWDKDIIQVALSLWNRSPQGYNNLRDSNMFQLPSESLLQRYKNCFSQQPGLNDNMFTWMYNEAVRFKCDRFGGIVLDEMAIQEDLKMAFGNNKISLDGLVDLGSTCSNMHLLNTHCNDIRLASHILQFIFLGYDGFRFPFAYYPTTGANAPEMFVILWEAIGKLSTFDFTVDYVSFDGASNNRSLQMMHFRDKSDAYDSCFTTVNPYQPSDKVTMIMDYSHNIKKWRNNVYASGDTEYSTRKLKLSSGFVIWDYWIKAYNWDRIHNAVRVHPKLTDEHIFLSKTSKMRNHLAEDVLDKEMLNLMKVYQQSLKSGSHLDSAVSMLEKTSILVQVFRDPRPINDLNDLRLSQLRDVETWLNNWEEQVKALESVTSAEKAKMLMSHETMNDVRSMLKGFGEICKRRVVIQKRSLVPAGLNSDIVENFFCQQRTICHGSNTNPSVYQYKYGITATILGQNAVSKKSNAASKSKRAIQPFCFTAPVTLAKKPCIRI